MIECYSYEFSKSTKNFIGSCFTNWVFNLICEKYTTDFLIIAERKRKKTYLHSSDTALDQIQHYQTTCTWKSNLTKNYVNIEDETTSHIPIYHLKNTPKTSLPILQAEVSHVLLKQVALYLERAPYLADRL